MFIYNYRFTNHVFKIDTRYQYFHDMAKEYRINDKEEYLIKIKDEDIVNWKNNHPSDLDDSYLETLVVHSKISDILASQDVFIFHGSAIFLDNKDNGYIFTGPSGVGKSTHVARLKQYYKDRLEIVNDDKPFIDKDYILYGSPWNGKSHLSNNINAKLKAIFIIFQSIDNQINRLSPDEALTLLAKQVHIPKGIEASSKGLTYLIKLVKDIPIYHLGLNLDRDSINNTINIIEGNN